ncbi:MAG: DUF342 domain-containing protein [Bacteroidetes bacterium]|nr:DUF342 domain-containing protein [Bacteroidota bacterium]
MADVLNPPKARIAAVENGARALFETSEPAPPGTWTPEQLRTMLSEGGIIVGIHDDVLDKIAAEGCDGSPVVVATAEPGTPGRDGWIEYFFRAADAPPAPATGEEKTFVPHRILNVEAGQKLCAIHPPEPGCPGLSVTGVPIPVRQGKKASCAPGPHTIMDQDGCTLLAAINGCPVKRPDGSVEVQPVVTIAGNLDYTIGNVDFIGSLIVRGDVKGDLTVKVKGNIDIHGNVEDAVIEAGGDIVVHQGFSGHGKGRLSAAGNVKVHYVMNQSVVAVKDVQITRECINASIDAGGKIIGPMAVIAGGKLDAVMGVEVGDIGSMDLSSAKVRVGRRGRILEHLAQVDKDIKQVERQQAEVKDAVYKLVKLKLDVGTLPADKEQLLAKLQEAQKLLPKRGEALHAEKEVLQADLQKKSDARIIVRGTIHKDTMIEVNGVRKFIEGALQGVAFAEHAGVLEAHAA